MDALLIEISVYTSTLARPLLLLSLSLCLASGGGSVKAVNRCEQVCWRGLISPSLASFISLCHIQLWLSVAASLSFWRDVCPPNLSVDKAGSYTDYRDPPEPAPSQALSPCCRWQKEASHQPQTCSNLMFHVIGDIQDQWEYWQFWTENISKAHVGLHIANIQQLWSSGCFKWNKQSDDLTGYKQARGLVT